MASYFYGFLSSLAVGLSLLFFFQTFRQAGTRVREIQPDLVWAVTIFAVLLAGRWPGLFSPVEFNPDESQLLAGALTLKHDPVFWRSVDGVTAGPLDFFALWPAGWIVGANNYVSARLTALVLLAGALWLTYRAITTVFGRPVARAATFPATCFEAFTLHPDFLHYSTELVPLFLLALAFYLAAQWGTRSRVARSGLKLGVIGFILGAIPFAKLQAGPMAAAGGLALLGHLLLRCKRREAGSVREVLALVGGALLPLSLVALQLTITSQWRHAVIPYLLANFSYVGAGLPTIFATSGELAANLAGPATLYVPFVGTSLILLILIQRRAQGGDLAQKIFLFAAIGFLAISVFCVLTPHRPFPHYLQLTVIPLALVVGATLGLADKARGETRALTVLTLVLTAGVPLFIRASTRQAGPGRSWTYQPMTVEPVAQKIREYGNVGESLGLWGWHCRYYVETGMWHATRDPWSSAEILKNDFADYYHQRYLADLQKNLPPVFVDASDTADNPFPPERVAHENFYPALGRFVASNYTLVSTVEKIRIYARNDRAPVKAVPPVISGLPTQP